MISFCCPHSVTVIYVCCLPLLSDVHADYYAPFHEMLQGLEEGFEVVVEEEPAAAAQAQQQQ